MTPCDQRSVEGLERLMRRDVLGECHETIDKIPWVCVTEITEEICPIWTPLAYEKLSILGPGSLKVAAAISKCKIKVCRSIDY